MRHLALAVTDQGQSRRFYETYFGFDAKPPRPYDDGVIMLYNAEGFSLALGPTDEKSPHVSEGHIAQGKPIRQRSVVSLGRDRSP
jgi:hypothetical protein